jgi:hypothetical protein
VFLANAIFLENKVIRFQEKPYAKGGKMQDLIIEKEIK